MHGTEYGKNVDANIIGSCTQQCDTAWNKTKTNLNKKRLGFSNITV